MSSTESRPKELFDIENEKAFEQFWNEALYYADTECVIEVGDMYACLFQVCGMASYQAVERMLELKDEDKFLFHSQVWSHSFEEPDRSNYASFRKACELYLNRSGMMKFKRWARYRSEELYALNVRQFDWKLKDGETELRFLLDNAKRTMEMTGVVNQTLSNTILNCVKELNLLYGYTQKGNSAISDGAKNVIFMNEAFIPA